MFYIELIIFTVVFVLNLMLIFAFYKTSRPFSVTAKLFIYLSIIDLIGVTSFITNLLLVTFNEQMTCALFLSIFSFSQFVMFTGTYLFCTISVLRLISLRKPFLYIRMRYVYYALFVEILISTSSSFWSLLYIENQFGIRFMQTASIVVSTAQLFFVGSTLIVNVLSYTQLTERASSVKQNKYAVELGYNGPTHENTDQEQSARNKREAVKTLIYITVVCLVCHTPYVVVNIFAATGKWEDMTLRGVCSTLAVCNSGLNALIYMLRTKKIRQVYECKTRQ